MYIEVLLHYSLVSISLRYYLIRSKEKVCMRAYLQLCHPKMSRMVRVLYNQFGIHIITTVNNTKKMVRVYQVSFLYVICTYVISISYRIFYGFLFKNKKNIYT